MDAESFDKILKTLPREDKIRIYKSWKKLYKELSEMGKKEIKPMLNDLIKQIKEEKK